MKIKYISDLHCEFHLDGGKSFIDSLPTDETRVLVLAGDIATKKSLANVLSQFCDKYEDVIYIPGNHEYYHSNWEEIQELIGKCCSKNSNLHHLDKKVVMIEGQRFIGATLWFKFDWNNDQYKHRMNDFRVIQDFEEWVYVENQSAMGFLEGDMFKGDVVVSHYLPTEESVSSTYKGSPLNRFFLCDMSQLIEHRKPSAWIHGHTHSSCNYEFGDTRIVCNPFGYARMQENKEFDPGLILKLRGKDDTETT